MNNTKTIALTVSKALGAVFVAILFLVAGQVVTSTPDIPVIDVQSESFSLTSQSYLVTNGVFPADILGLGGDVLIGCEHLGLLCHEPMTNAYDDLSGISYGDDFQGGLLAPFQFSVAPGSIGLQLTAVSDEFNCVSPEAHTDVFRSYYDGNNFQDLDGDGVACAGNDGFSLYLTESTFSDDINALERDPCTGTDYDCDGIPNDPVFFTLKSGSPSLSFLGFSTSDILAVGLSDITIVWASSEDLGLDNSDMIDALCIREDGNGFFSQNDLVWISLAPGSPSLGRLGASPADVLQIGPLHVVVDSFLIGLNESDNLDGMTCTKVYDSYALMLPIIVR